MHPSTILKVVPAALCSLALHAAALTLLSKYVAPPLPRPNPLHVTLVTPPEPNRPVPELVRPVQEPPRAAVEPSLPAVMRPSDAPVKPVPTRASPARPPAPAPPPTTSAPAPALSRPTAPEAPAQSQPVVESTGAAAAPPALGMIETPVEPAAPGPTGDDRPVERPPTKSEPVRAGPRVDASWAGNTAPEYPPLSRRLREQGEVRLDVHVGADGWVTDVRLARSSGSPRLDDMAMQTVKKWRFTPATEDGQPVADWYRDWLWTFRYDD